ncbi:unnamed protein product [Polarella glacialis]|uniref:Uncharacterized protein n=1 Tax=Polarella glacialis TaxID=89957 RepID=A0A813LT34_POLGL|nr:unnamed protein product [Polarella glacialis]
MVCHSAVPCGRQTGRPGNWLLAVVCCWCLARPALLLFCGRSAPSVTSATRRAQKAPNCLPIELLTLPALDLYTSNKGVVPAPLPQLPDGKRSVFDGVPLLQDDASSMPADADAIQAAAAQFTERLVGEVVPLDFLSAALILLGLCLGLLDTRRRWISYAADSLAWSLHGFSGSGAVVPARLVPSGPQDIETARSSWSNCRRLVSFLRTARVPDKLRAAAAADAAEAADARLGPLAEAVRSACSAALLRGETDPLPVLDGEWDCACDYFANGAVIPVLMRIRGSVGEYRAEGRRHDISGITARRQGSVVVVDFLWSNLDSSSGSGNWLISANGDFLAGTWSQDGTDGAWSWNGRRKAAVSSPPPPGTVSGVDSTSPQELAAKEFLGDLGSETALAAAALTQSMAREPDLAREKLARVWDDTAPVQPTGTGGDFAQSALLPDRWRDAGSEMRAVMGLTSEGLISAELRSLATAICFLLFAVLALVLARALELGVGNPEDSASYSLFFAGYTVLLDVSVKGRREGIMRLTRSPEEQKLRELRLAALCRWANGGALLRTGEVPRIEVLEAIRKAVPKLRAFVLDSELEDLLKVWQPDLKRRVLRTASGTTPAIVTYENLSLDLDVIRLAAESEPVLAEPRTIWR